MIFAEQLKIEHAAFMKKKAHKEELKAHRLQAAAERAATKAKREDTSMFVKAHEMHWTDASKYAETYYGETYRETTRHDNNWD